MSGALTRRDILVVSASAAVSPTFASAAPALTDWNAPVSATPAARLRIKARVMGTAGSGEVHRLSQGHCVAYLSERDEYVSLFSVLTYHVARWALPQAEHREFRQYEASLYTRFGTIEVLNEYQNPLTGATNVPFHAIAGPIDVRLSAESTAPGAGSDVRPQEFGWTINGGILSIAQQSDLHIQNPVSREQWPTIWSGPTLHFNTCSTVQALWREAADERRPSVRAWTAYEQNASWPLWMEMADRKGCLTTRGSGTKLTGLGEMAHEVRRAFEQYAPEMFALDGWHARRDPLAEFLQRRRTGGSSHE